MKKGYLSQYFEGIAFKRLSRVEVDMNRSHQHEFNGVTSLRGIFPSEKERFGARFLYLTDQDPDDAPVADDGSLTWYDARWKARTERQVMRRECRLYYSDNRVLSLASEGDLLVVARQPGGSLLVVVAEKDTTAEGQLRYLFGLGDACSRFSTRSGLETEQDRIGFTKNFILEQIGIRPECGDSDDLEQMPERFREKWPTTADFSKYARTRVPDMDCRKDPDGAMIAWMEEEERLYRILEKHFLSGKISNFGNSDAGQNWEPLTKSVQSMLERRKSRAGKAMENHLGQIFRGHGIACTRCGTTEDRHRPDFVFPDIGCYHDANFPDSDLTVLASKYTCRDRWRQILNEAARVPVKHLVTLEPGISEHQTGEMMREKVRLVLPSSLHSSFTGKQRGQLMTISGFLDLVRERQLRYPKWREAGPAALR